MAYPVDPFVRPAVLAGQQNGKLPASILVDTPGQAGGSTVRLVEPAARSWRALCAAALVVGHVLKAVGPLDSFRPYDTQERIFRQRYTTSELAGRPSKIWNGQRWWQRPGTAVAAVPGTSNHGWACAVDTGEERDSDAAAESLDNPTLAWLLANEQRFGWSHEVQSEPWHLRYNAGDAIPRAVLDYERGAAPQPPQEDDVFDLVVCRSDRRAEMPSPEMANAWWFITAAERAWCPTEGNAKQAADRGQLREGGYVRGSDGKVFPVEVSPSYILEKRPMHAIDRDLQGGVGPSGHFPQ